VVLGPDVLRRGIHDRGRDRLYGNRIIGISTAVTFCIRDSKSRFSICLYLFARSSLSLFFGFVSPKYYYYSFPFLLRKSV
jgi:hypothetical protein